jgi:hypothetical protein
MHATDLWATDARKVWGKSRMRATYIPDSRNPFNPVWLSQPPGFPSARPADDVVDDLQDQGASSGEDSDEVIDLILPDEDEELSDEEPGSPDMPTKG